MNEHFCKNSLLILYSSLILVACLKAIETDFGSKSFFKVGRMSFSQITKI